ncbi:MAG: TraB/GumN family protein [Campylobacterales bacterium]|nr:TraB/GumN family protein [Campylobacterales bacterium]
MVRAFLAVLVLTLLGNAKGSVWRVTNAKNETIFLGGTIHLLRSSDYPLPKVYYDAYQKSQIVVFETDIKDETMGAYMAQMSLYPKGVKLQEKLSADTYQTLQNYCNKINFPMILIERMKAPLAMLALSLHKLQEMGFYATNGIDLHFYNQALSERKKILTFETPKEQIDMLLGMGEGKEDEMVRYTLKDLEEIESYFIPLLQAWREGNRTLMIESLLQSFEKYPAIYESLLVHRNQKWLLSIEQYFTTKEIEFILVGAAHLIGKDGLLQYFEKKGYKVEQVQ